MQQSEETREVPVTEAEIAEQESPEANQVPETAEDRVDEQQPGTEPNDASAHIKPEQEEQSATLFVAQVEESASDQDEQRQALKAVIEAAIYITDEPLTPDQISKAIDQPIETVKEI